MPARSTGIFAANNNRPYFVLIPDSKTYEFGDLGGGVLHSVKCVSPCRWHPVDTPFIFVLLMKPHMSGVPRPRGDEPASNCGHQFAQVLGRLRFDDKVLEWARMALNVSHAEEQHGHKAAISRLDAECKRLGERIDAIN